MRVQEVMKHEAATCGPDATLLEVGRRMVEVGCGVLPVVTSGARVIGILTDRDICCTLARDDRQPSQVKVRQAMTPDVYSCRREDSLKSALDTMRLCRVRRLPVIDAEGRLEGILSLDEIVLWSGDEPGPTAAEVLETLRAINEHALPAER